MKQMDKNQKVYSAKEILIPLIITFLLFGIVMIMLEGRKESKSKQSKQSKQETVFHYQIKHFFKAKLNDPSSLEIVSSTKPFKKPSGEHIVVVKIRAKNSFNAKILKRYRFTFDLNDKIKKVEEV